MDVELAPICSRYTFPSPPLWGSLILILAFRTFHFPTAEPFQALNHLNYDHSHPWGHRFHFRLLERPCSQLMEPFLAIGLSHCLDSGPACFSSEGLGFLPWGPLRPTVLRSHLLVCLREHRSVSPLTSGRRRVPEGSPAPCLTARPSTSPSPGCSGHRLQAG